jgi:hypothetical protein
MLLLLRNVGSISHILHPVLFYLQFTGCRDPKPFFLSAVANRSALE